MRKTLAKVRDASNQSRFDSLFGKEETKKKYLGIMSLERRGAQVVGIG